MPDLPETTAATIEGRVNQIEVNLGRLAESANRTQEELRQSVREQAALAKEVREFMARPTDTTQLTRWLALVVTVLLAGIGAMVVPWASSVRDNSTDLDKIVGIVQEMGERQATTIQSVDDLKNDTAIINREILSRAERLAVLERDAYWARDEIESNKGYFVRRDDELSRNIEKLRDAESLAQQQEEKSLRAREASQAQAAYESFTTRLQDMETRSEQRDQMIMDRMDRLHGAGGGQ